MRTRCKRAAWRVGQRVDSPGDCFRIVLDLRLPGTVNCQWAIIRSKSLHEPQVERHIRLLKVERLQPMRTNTLCIPGMNELMRQRTKLSKIRAQQRLGAGKDRRIAMLHAIAGDIRQVVCNECVHAIIKFRQLTEYFYLFSNNLFRFLEKFVYVLLISVVMDSEPYCLGFAI